MTPSERINAVLDSLAQAQRILDPSLLDRSIDDLHGLDDELGDDAARARVLANLGEALRQRFELHSDRNDLNRAIEVQERALTLAPDGDPVRSFVLRSSSVLRQTRAERYGGPDVAGELRTAEEQAWEAVQASGPTDARRPARLHTLASAQRLRYTIAGSRRHLADAVRTARQAYAAAPGDPVLASHLSLTLRLQYERTGRITDLHAAIEMGRAAAVGDDRVHAPMTWTNLSTLLEARYAHLGDSADLADAVQAARRAVDLTEPEMTHHGMYLAVLAEILLVRARPADLDEAVRTTGRAVTATPTGTAHRCARSALLARALLARGGPGDGRRAAEVGREAAAFTLRSPQPDVRVLHTAAAAVHAQPPGRDEAIGYAAKALALAEPDDPVRAAIEVDLGDWTADREPQVAVGHYRGASSQRTAPPSLRCDAARRWATAARSAGDMPAAADAYRVAVGLMPAVASLGLRRADRERHLSERSGLAGDAAATAVQQDLAGLAVQLLEQGRGVLHGQLLDTRADLSALRSAHPDLASRMSGLAVLLDRVTVGG